MKKTILTGLKPTGSLTLGNYVGAISQIVKLQDEYNSYLFIADMHAITVPNDRGILHNNIRDFIALYIACGIDPNKNVLYLQSDIEFIPAISWLLECSTYYGEASRMIQFKEKSKGQESCNVGIFNYPILMAADILLYDAEFIPLGEDQFQHIELTRDIAIRVNHRYGDIFTVPEKTSEQAKFMGSNDGIRIRDLVNPEKKMSKSAKAEKL